MRRELKRYCLAAACDLYSRFPQALNTLDAPEAVGHLKYMLLCKIMTSKADAEEIPAVISSKAGLKYAGAFTFKYALCKLPPAGCRRFFLSIAGRQEVPLQLQLRGLRGARPVNTPPPAALLTSRSRPFIPEHDKLVRLAGEEVDSMAAVAKAYADRSLQGFQAALDAHSAQLAGDPVVHTHLQVGCHSPLACLNHPLQLHDFRQSSCAGARAPVQRHKLGGTTFAASGKLHACHPSHEPGKKLFSALFARNAFSSYKRDQRLERMTRTKRRPQGVHR